MKHKFFRIPAYGGDPEAELNQFAATHRIVAVERQFVAIGTDSYWAFCFRYQDGDEAPALLRKGKIDYRDVLSEGEFAVFAKLRSLAITAHADARGFRRQQLARVPTRVAC